MTSAAVDLSQPRKSEVVDAVFAYLVYARNGEYRVVIDELSDFSEAVSARPPHPDEVYEALTSIQLNGEEAIDYASVTRALPLGAEFAFLVFKLSDGRTVMSTDYTSIDLEAERTPSDEEVYATASTVQKDIHTQEMAVMAAQHTVSLINQMAQAQMQQQMGAQLLNDPNLRT